MTNNSRNIFEIYKLIQSFRATHKIIDLPLKINYGYYIKYVKIKKINEHDKSKKILQIKAKLKQIANKSKSDFNIQMKEVNRRQGQPNNNRILRTGQIGTRIPESKHADHLIIRLQKCCSFTHNIKAKHKHFSLLFCFYHSLSLDL